jgi:bacterioferritin-associated ferredoxin
MIVCICHRVSDRDIASAIHAGCLSFEDLQVDLGVATACGGCGDCARDTFNQHAAQAGVCIITNASTSIPITLHMQRGAGAAGAA